MRALLINPETRSIEEVEISGRDDIVRLVGYETIESDEIGPNGDRLFFDEECFLRGASARLQIDSVVPVSGTCVIASANEDGSDLKDVRSTPDTIQARLKYL
nr:hypothetical protein [Thioalkalivibrio sp.]